MPHIDFSITKNLSYEKEILNKNFVKTVLYSNNKNGYRIIIINSVDKKNKTRNTRPDDKEKYNNKNYNTFENVRKRNIHQKRKKIELKKKAVKIIYNKKTVSLVINKPALLYSNSPRLLLKTRRNQINVEL